MNISASATVILTIEIRASGGYGDKWAISELHDQVAREAEAAVLGKFPGARIIGKPKVKVCTFEVERP